METIINGNIPRKNRDDEIHKDAEQLLYAYVPYVQETEENANIIRREMEYTKMDQVALLGIFYCYEVITIQTTRRDTGEKTYERKS